MQKKKKKKKNREKKIKNKKRKRSTYLANYKYNIATDTDSPYSGTRRVHCRHEAGSHLCQLRSRMLYKILASNIFFNIMRNTHDALESSVWSYWRGFDVWYVLSLSMQLHLFVLFRVVDSFVHLIIELHSNWMAMFLEWQFDNQLILTNKDCHIG